jgi:hypothetical protein
MVVVAACLLTGCTSTVSGSAVRDAAVAPANVGIVAEADIDDIMLTVDDIGDIVGARDLKVLLEAGEMSDNADSVSDPDCLGSIFAAEETVYEGTDWTAVRDQVVGDDENDRNHWVEQSVVLYPSERQAREFYEQSVAAWEDCAGFSIAVDDYESTYIWHVEGLETRGDVIAQVTVQEDLDDWQCQHALSAVSNLTVETWACAFGIEDQAVDMVEKILENAAAR